MMLLLLFSTALAQKNNVQSAAKAIGLTSITARDGSLVSGIKEKYDEIEDDKSIIDLVLENCKSGKRVKMW